jgi:aryl-phospho-beta-D-glucosidase BglC (GH1 family)
MVTTASAYTAGSLSVRGNQLVYHDRPVHLQGVAVGDPLLGRQGRPLADYKTIANDWNANAVRISVHPGAWRDFGRLRAQEALTQNVNAALDAGLFVILTWHAIGIPNGYYQKAPDGMAADIYDSDFALAKDFWRHMSWQFGREGRVIFELWNEPVYETPPPEGESRWPQLRPFWQELTALIRDNGGRNVLLATSHDWGYGIRGIGAQPLDDANTAYAWHVYAGTDHDNPSLWLRQLDGLHLRKPVIMTEWGFEPHGTQRYRGTAEGYGAAIRALLKAQELHYTAWCWHPTWTPAMLKEDWATPTEYGQFVKDTLAQAKADTLARP